MHLSSQNVNFLEQSKAPAHYAAGAFFLLIETVLKSACNSSKLPASHVYVFCPLVDTTGKPGISPDQ